MHMHVSAVSCVLHVMMMKSLRSLNTAHRIRNSYHIKTVKPVSRVGHRQRGKLTSSGLPASWRHGKGIMLFKVVCMIYFVYF